MDKITFSIEDKIATIRIENNRKANILTLDMLKQLGTHIAAINEDKTIASCILTSSGDRSFCGGANIANWKALDQRDFAFTWIKQGNEVFDSVIKCRVPVIGVAKGPAVGGGLELFSACDLRIADEEAWFSLPETSLGIVPGWSGTQRLASYIPAAILKDMVLCGKRLDSKKAFDIGFLSTVVANGVAEDTAFEMASNIAERDPRATEVAKVMLNHALGEEARNALDLLGSGYLK